MTVLDSGSTCKAHMLNSPMFLSIMLSYGELFVKNNSECNYIDLIFQTTLRSNTLRAKKDNNQDQRKSTTKAAKNKDQINQFL